jgi:hypothetical protein
MSKSLVIPRGERVNGFVLEIIDTAPMSGGKAAKAFNYYAFN